MDINLNRVWGGCSHGRKKCINFVSEHQRLEPFPHGKKNTAQKLATHNLHNFPGVVGGGSKKNLQIIRPVFAQWKIDETFWLIFTGWSALNWVFLLDIDAMILEWGYMNIILEVCRMGCKGKTRENVGKLIQNADGWVNGEVEWRFSRELRASNNFDGVCGLNAVEKNWKAHPVFVQDCLVAEYFISGKKNLYK